MSPRPFPGSRFAPPLGRAPMKSSARRPSPSSPTCIAASTRAARRCSRRRAERQKRFDAGELPDFLIETRAIREGDWKVAPIPADLLDRRVEITGPVDRKMIVNALNSGAKVFMADFEDASSPAFANMIEGQANLLDLWNGRIDFTDAASGKLYAVKPNPAALMVRPRGWHLDERHLLVDGEPMSGSLFDFGLYVFHSARLQMAKGSTPGLLPAQAREPSRGAAVERRLRRTPRTALGVAHGTFKATVLIETLPAAFEMDEILFELKDHIVGLNCGRWDYIFSFIKRLGKNPAFLTPDRAAMTMGKAFLAAYSLLLIKTCHRRGAFAMGGMAAQIPIKGDPAANEAAFAKVRADKEREAGNGHDGTWVAHPDLVPVAQAGVRPADAAGQPALRHARRRQGDARGHDQACTTARARRAACARTSASACNISKRGCAAAAPCRSTT